MTLPIKVFDVYFTRCPLSAVSMEAMEVVNTVFLSEGGGFGASRVLPSAMLTETAFYWNVRSIVLSEHGRLEKLKKKKEKK